MVLFTPRQTATAAIRGRGGRVVPVGRDGDAGAPHRRPSYRWSGSRPRSARGNAGPPRPRRPSKPTMLAAAFPGSSTQWTASPRPMVKPLVVGGRPGPPLCCRARTHSSSTVLHGYTDPLHIVSFSLAVNISSPPLRPPVLATPTTCLPKCQGKIV
jgi:hypothetical protein